MPTELQQAGLAHLLYARCERACGVLSAGEHTRCRRQYEHWINFVWDHAEVVSFLSDATIRTGHDFVLWLRKHVPQASRSGKQKGPDSARA